MEIINRQQIGNEAEEKAREFLEAKGFQVIEKNYKCYVGEIDLIMQDQEDIVFVEVRSRKHIQYGNALESVDRQKIHKLVRAATHFLQTKKWLYKRNSRFDIIAIRLAQGKMQLDWVKNAFTVDKYI
jgi:putative endonuclease